MSKHGIGGRLVAANGFWVVIMIADNVIDNHVFQVLVYCFYIVWKFITIFPILVPSEVSEGDGIYLLGRMVSFVCSNVGKEFLVLEDVRN